MFYRLQSADVSRCWFTPLHLNRADTDTSSCMSKPCYISLVPARSLPRFIHHIHSPSLFPSLRILHILHLNPTTATAYIPQLSHPQLNPHYHHVTLTPLLPSLCLRTTHSPCNLCSFSCRYMTLMYVDITPSTSSAVTTPELP